MRVPHISAGAACPGSGARHALVRSLLAVFLMGIPVVHPHTQEVLEQERPVHRATYAIVRDPADRDAAAITRALETSVFPAVQALWFTGDPHGVQATAAATITVERRREAAFAVSLEVVSTDDQRVLGTYSRTVRVDPAGRYAVAALWQPVIAALQEALDSKDPRVPLRVSGPAGAAVRVRAGTVLVEGTLPRGGAVEILLARFQHLEVDLSLAGYRSAQKTIFLADAPADVVLDLYRYPRHTAAIFLQELSFPEVEYTFFAPQGRWTASVGATSYLVGITPFRELNDAHQSPQLISSMPLTRITATGGVLLRDRDHPLRIHLQGGVFLRLVHGEGLSGLEPVLPSGAVLRIGAEVEVAQRLVLSAALGSDAYWPVAEPFVGSQVLLRRVGPVVLQTGLLRAGVRVRL